MMRRCEECGKLQSDMYSHLRNKHKMTAEEFEAKHGILYRPISQMVPKDESYKLLRDRRNRQL